MKNTLQTIGLALACFSMIVGLIAMVFVAAFPTTPEEEKIAEDNRESAKIRAELYRSME